MINKQVKAMTLQEIKDKYGQEYGCKDWMEYKEDLTLKDIEEDLDEIAKRYAKDALYRASILAILTIDGKNSMDNGQLFIVSEGNHYNETEVRICQKSITNIILD